MAELAGKRADTFPVSRERVNRGLLVLLGAAVVFCGCMAYLEISPSEAVKGFPDRKSTRPNSSHMLESGMASSAC